MVKVSTSDALAILRLFTIADEKNVPRNIDRLSFKMIDDTTTVASFRFNKRSYYAVFDAKAEDNTQQIIYAVRSVAPNSVGEVLENPKDNSITTYAVPFKGKDVYLFVETPLKSRLDLTLAEQYPDISRSTWQKYIRAGSVTVNGTVQQSPKFDVVKTDDISVTFPQKNDYSNQELPVIYIDDNVIVINKPAGVLTHAKGALNDEFTVADFFRRYTTFGLETNRPGIVHRLDRDTSGVMIGARNEETATLLQKQFADRRVKKTYIAVVAGHLKNASATIDLPIGRHPSMPSTFKVDAKGKRAITHYETIASNDDVTVIELSPITGRTHQLRVHLQYLHAPIVGDRVYGNPAQRLYLHAKNLEITIPQGERKTFTADVPTNFFTDFNLES